MSEHSILIQRLRQLQERKEYTDIWLTEAEFKILADALESPSYVSREAALEAQVEHAVAIIHSGLDLMTSDQVGKWAGVREWLERDAESYISPSEKS